MQAISLVFWRPKDVPLLRCGIRAFRRVFIVVVVWRSVKNFAVWTSLKKSSKEKGRVVVKLLTIKTP